MTAQLPDDFELTLYIALKLLPRSAKLGMAAKLPQQNDDGCKTVAKLLAKHLRHSNLTIIQGPPLNIHWTRADDENYAERQKKGGEAEAPPPLDRDIEKPS